HRIIKTLTQLAEAFGPERMASISREITKLYEETITDTLENLVIHFTHKAPKGEFVLVIKAK
ncbi:MAG: 16S rRNA (cytidine1402-2'-O)-methyltransferase, partial [Marivirga sp.]